MNELIKINYESEQPTVSARDLYEGLMIKSKYIDWFNRMKEYGFTENIDYVAVSQEKETAQGNKSVFIEHLLSIDTAKQICMLQRSSIGRRYRQYFLELEKAWNTPEQVMARALKMADTKIKGLQTENNILIEDNQRMKPKEVFADAVSVSRNSILIGELAKMIKQNGIDIGQNRLFEWLRNNEYLIKRKGTDYNSPTQKSMDLELFEIKETCITHSDGHTSISKTTKVTGKGQLYFINKFLSRKKAG